MPMIEVAKLSGVVYDSYSASAENLSDALNVRVRDGGIEMFLGEGQVYGTPSVTPLFCMSVNVGAERGWVYAGTQKAYYVSPAAVHTNITRQTAGVDVNYAATKWNGCVLNGLPVINNGVDLPQMWSPVSVGQKLQALSAWPATNTCRFMRSFRNFLVAGNVTVSGTNKPHQVKWSHPADPGAVPVSWDETDATKDAGIVDLEGADALVDGLQLRDRFILYKETSTYVMDFIGAPSIFRFSKLFGDFGALTTNCVVEFEDKHCVLTASDVIVHDGSAFNSILDKRMRRWLFQNIDSTQYEKCFVAKNQYFSEIWICFPEIGETSCTKALVWNWREDALTVRELPNANHIGFGQVDAAQLLSWDADTTPWDSDLTAWNQLELTPNLPRTLIASADTKLLLADAFPLFGSEYITSFAEKTGIQPSSPNSRKSAGTLRPQIRGQDGATVRIRMGGHDDVDGPIEWSAPFTFTIGVDDKADFRVNGRFLAWRIESSTAYTWRLQGLSIEFQEASAR